MISRKQWLALLLLPAAAVSADSLISSSAADSESVPAFLIEVPSSVPDVLIADAENAALLRFTRSETGMAEESVRYMSVGQNGVGKQRAWDKKTPLGIYFITEELDATRLAAKYGEAAFVLDYPNAWDIANERTGYGIWLHGVDPALDRRPRRDTDGCLALPNDQLLSLATRLMPNVTPVIIARELAWTTPRELAVLRGELRGALESWRASIEDEDVLRYLGMYDDAFISGEMNKSQWAVFNLGVFESRDVSRVVIDDVLLLQDPEADGLYLSRFSQTLETSDGPVTMRKRLYWRKAADGWRIVSEDVG